MSNDTAPNTAKKRPDYIAFAVHAQGGSAGPNYTRIGVGFTLKSGGISVLYDAIPLSGQIVLLGIDQGEKPATIRYGAPTRKPDFEASMVRGEGGNAFWTPVGAAYRQDGYLSVLCHAVPTGGKIVLTVPRDNA